MIRKNTLVIGIVTVWLAVLGVVSFAQDTGQNKYTVSVPGGLSFSEFRATPCSTTTTRQTPSRLVPRQVRLRKATMQSVDSRATPESSPSTTCSRSTGSADRKRIAT